MAFVATLSPGVEVEDDEQPASVTAAARPHRRRALRKRM